MQACAAQYCGGTTKASGLTRRSLPRPSAVPIESGLVRSTLATLVFWGGWPRSGNLYLRM